MENNIAFHFIILFVGQWPLKRARLTQVTGIVIGKICNRQCLVF